MKRNIPSRPSQVTFIYLGLCSLALCVFMLSPILNSGFFGDDAKNSFINGDVAYGHLNLLQFILSSIKSWMYIGRFFPLATVNTILLFTFINNLVLYKLLTIIFIIVNILIFGYLIRLMTDSTSVKLLAVLLIPIFFQSRMFHDPIMSFAWLLQIVFFYTAVSLISLIIYLKNGKRGYLILS